MKKLLSIGLLLTFFLPGIVRLWTIAEFEINRDLIADMFCVNKKEPITVCYGSCYLTKQLEKTEGNQQNDLPIAVRQVESIQLFLEITNTEQPSLASDYINVKNFPCKVHLKGLNISKDIEHPPQAQRA